MKTRVHADGPDRKGFHTAPNVLRDLYLPDLGLDGYGFANYLLSWANSDMELSQRRMMRDCGASQGKLETVQRKLLEVCGHFVRYTPGNFTTANRWDIDLDTLWTENARHMAKLAEERALKAAARGPRKAAAGRAEGVPETDTPGSNGVAETGTPPAQGVAETGTGCSGNQYRGVPESDTSKEHRKDKEIHSTPTPRTAHYTVALREGELLGVFDAWSMHLGLTGPGKKLEGEAWQAALVKGLSASALRADAEDIIRTGKAIRNPVAVLSGRIKNHLAANEAGGNARHNPESSAAARPPAIGTRLRLPGGAVCTVTGASGAAVYTDHPEFDTVPLGQLKNLEVLP